MDFGYEALVKRDTWVLVPYPSHTNTITCILVFTLKDNLDGTIHLCKGSL